MAAENGRRIAFMAILYLPISAIAVSLLGHIHTHTHTHNADYSKIILRE